MWWRRRHAPWRRRTAARTSRTAGAALSLSLPPRCASSRWDRRKSGRARWRCRSRVRPAARSSHRPRRAAAPSGCRRAMPSLRRSGRISDWLREAVPAAPGRLRPATSAWRRPRPSARPGSCPYPAPCGRARAPARSGNWCRGLRARSGRSARRPCSPWRRRLRTPWPCPDRRGPAWCRNSVRDRRRRWRDPSGSAREAGRNRARSGCGLRSHRDGRC